MVESKEQREYENSWRVVVIDGIFVKWAASERTSELLFLDSIIVRREVVLVLVCIVRVSRDLVDFSGSQQRTTFHLHVAFFFVFQDVDVSFPFVIFIDTEVLIVNITQ